MGNMLTGIDALLALQRFGTVTEAAVQLRLTQSAVSKRIHTLQDELGYALVEPAGRRLRLTPLGADFLERARPLVAELRGLGARSATEGINPFSLALADSIAASWGPGVLRRALARLPGLRVDLHSHRSVLVVESVRLGRYHLGMCTDADAADLVHHPIVAEPMVLVHSPGTARPSARAPLITIEPSAASWKAIEPLLRAHHRELLGRTLIPVESFGAALQMVRAGFGEGLIPLGLALENRVQPGCCRRLAGVARPVALLVRKTVNALPGFVRLREALRKAAEAYFATSARSTSTRQS
ncbi:MAG TPA: LysR family transcriptional regulator [Casimicrobiaceae bacterium]|nr:LysR family transcriptional regulator [Casimicrobiaceae bacterium]